jgi:processive 1,2-diacylglycerol beta-glucosyltransferase
MVISQIVPGQEEGNARLIVESGAGCIAHSPDAIVRALNDAFSNDGEVWRSWYQSMCTLSRPAASNEIADWLMALPEPISR